MDWPYPAISPPPRPSPIKGEGEKPATLRTIIFENNTLITIAKSSCRYGNHSKSPSQLVAMLYAQLSGKKSLRDLVFSLGRHQRKLYHLGLAPVKRSTLADANEQRPARIFAQTYFKLLHRLEAELPRHSGPRRVKIMDATYVPVCDSLFPWADFMPGKSAVKLHFLLAADAGAPQDLQVTSGQVHELEVARPLNFAPGDLLLLDRGYVDFAWLYSLHQQGVGFVTRLQRNIRYQVDAAEPRAC